MGWKNCIHEEPRLRAPVPALRIPSLHLCCEFIPPQSALTQGLPTCPADLLRLHGNWDAFTQLYFTFSFTGVKLTLSAHDSAFWLLPGIFPLLWAVASDSCDLNDCKHLACPPLSAELAPPPCSLSQQIDIQPHLILHLPPLPFAFNLSQWVFGNE